MPSCELQFVCGASRLLIFDKTPTIFEVFGKIQVFIIHTIRQLRNCLPFEVLIEFRCLTGVKYIPQLPNSFFELKKFLRAVLFGTKSLLYTAQISWTGSSALQLQLKAGSSRFIQKCFSIIYY